MAQKHACGTVHRKAKFGFKSYGGLTIFAGVDDFVPTHGADPLLIGALLTVVRVYLVNLQWRD